MLSSFSSLSSIRRYIAWLKLLQVVGRTEDGGLGGEKERGKGKESGVRHQALQPPSIPPHSQVLEIEGLRLKAEIVNAGVIINFRTIPLAFNYFGFTRKRGTRWLTSRNTRGGPECQTEKNISL